MSKLLERKYHHYKICVFRSKHNANIYIGEEVERTESSSLFKYTFILYPSKFASVESVFTKGPELIESHIFVGTVRMPTPKVVYYFDLTKVSQWLEPYKLSMKFLSNGWDIFYDELKKPIDEGVSKDYQKILKEIEMENKW